MLMTTLDGIEFASTYPDLLGKRVLITGIDNAQGVDIARAFAEQRTRLVLHVNEMTPEMEVLGEIVSQGALDVRLFDERMTRRIVTQARSAAEVLAGRGIMDFVNAGGLVVAGLEYQLRWKPVDGAELWLNQAFQRTRWDNGLDGPFAPANATTLAWFQKLPQGFDFAAIFQALGSLSWQKRADALPGRGIVEEGEAKVSDKVEVRLSGANFNIVAACPAVQSLSPMTEHTWRWSVTALSAGDHDLTFEVFAMDSDTATPLRTFRDTVTVKVSGLNRAIAFADQANPLFVLLGGLGSALAGLFGAIRFFGKK